MSQRVIYVMTWFYYLGEDGPTHQPIEQLSNLRSIPNLNVFRPADTIETFECWEIALSINSPSVIALSRQNNPVGKSIMIKISVLRVLRNIGCKNEIELTIINWFWSKLSNWSQS